MVSPALPLTVFKLLAPAAGRGKLAFPCGTGELSLLEAAVPAGLLLLHCAKCFVLGVSGETLGGVTPSANSAQSAIGAHPEAPPDQLAFCRHGGL